MKLATLLVFGLIFLTTFGHASQREDIGMENLDFHQLQRDQQNLQQGYQEISHDLANCRTLLGLPEMSPHMIAIGQKFQDIAIREYYMDEAFADHYQNWSNFKINYPFFYYLFFSDDWSDERQKQLISGFRQEQKIVRQELDERILFEAEHFGKSSVVLGKLDSIESKVDDLSHAMRHMHDDLTRIKAMLALIDQKTHPIENIRGSVQGLEGHVNRIDGHVEVLVKVHFPQSALGVVNNNFNE